MSKNKEIEQYEIVGPNWTPAKTNVNAILDEIKEVDDWCYEETKFDIGDGWIFELEERFGGHEGDGEVHWVVFSLTKEENKTYWQIDGYYQSYDGAYLDSDAYEVKAVEKTVIVWEAK